MSSTASLGSLDPEKLSCNPPPVETITSLQEIPDGGYLAWSQVVGGFFLTFNSGGIINAFGAFQTYYETELLQNHAPSSIAWIGSVQGFLLLVIGVLAGPVYDLGHFRLLLYIGSLMVVAGMMFTSISTGYYQVFLAQGLLIGAGAGCFYVPGLALLSSYFNKRRSFASGIAICGSSIGGAVFPAVFRALQPRIGFGWATRVLGFICLANFLLTAAIMRPRPGTQTRRKLIDLAAWRSPPYTLFTASIFLGYIGLYIPYIYIGAFAQARVGVGSSLAFYLVSIMNGVSVIGRTGPSWVADKLGPLNTLIVCSFICSTLVFSWIAISSLAGLIVFAVLYGVFQGTLVSLPAATIPSLSPDLKRVGAHMGMGMSCAGVGMLAGSPIAGALLNLHTADFLRAQIFCGAIVFASGLGYTAARVAKVGYTLRAFA
ncbi:MFS general substrate transporter [Vararia minispora EC-137]|uniref:MFS general substrate transporter n=1 Tax=Vararia minispora EC-137 TaxID=1314806 RepID=A0ACB8QB51_9AGAM|nr:MFS general substrate transporter [Vararia minispora EC-137]